ncbi:lysoplasmalogenase [bacterium]|nr:lysoplasmalogenase [bacterium]
MMMVSGWITAGVFLCAFLTILGRYRKRNRLVWIFKPLTMALIIALPVLAARRPYAPYLCWILAGLLFSLAGDVFLMLRRERFIAGLASFFAAHLFYIAAFVGFESFHWSPLFLIFFSVYGVIIYRFLSPHLGHYKRPVLAYVIVIVIMGWRAWARWDLLRSDAALTAACGALLFILSDSILAWNRFRQPFRSAEALKFAAYFSAQWMIAMSAVF